MSSVKRIGVLTGGGDAPGLNAVIRAVVKSACNAGIEVIGLEDSFDGLLDPKRTRRLTPRDVTGILRIGGTILGTTNRGNPFAYPLDTPEGKIDYSDRVVQTFGHMGLDALVVIGGDGTLYIAHQFALRGIPVVGVPKTIDNDISATDYTFGFDTAVQIATDSMDRLRTTGDSHGRCMIAEVMGRHVGWIALHSGMASGAHVILIPEQKTSMDAIIGWVTSAHDRGRAPLVVVSEGFTLDTMDDPHHERGLDAFGRPRLGGIGEILAPMIEERTGIETRATTLGHIQRGGTPTSYDRVLATRLGMAVLDLARDKQWGQMVALRGTEMVSVPFEAALGQLKTVPQERYDEAAILFG